MFFLRFVFLHGRKCPNIHATAKSFPRQKPSLDVVLKLLQPAKLLLAHSQVFQTDTGERARLTEVEAVDSDGVTLHRSVHHAFERLVLAVDHVRAAANIESVSAAFLTCCG